LELSEKTLVASAPSDEMIRSYLALGKTKADAFKDFAEGLNLKGRDLRFGNFDASILRKANLNQSNLQGLLFGGQNYRNLIWEEHNCREQHSLKHICRTPFWVEQT
jgi:uncharacterized protein YjbI with pentapeptide repeats